MATARRASRAKQQQAAGEDRKSLQLQLVDQLHRGRDNPALQTLVAFCQLRLELAKVSLLTASPETVAYLQGQARAYIDTMNVILIGPTEYPKKSEEN